MKIHELDWESYADAEAELIAWERAAERTFKARTTWRGGKRRASARKWACNSTAKAMRRKERELAHLALATWSAVGLPKTDREPEVPIPMIVQAPVTPPAPKTTWAFIVMLLGGLLRRAFQTRKISRGVR